MQPAQTPGLCLSADPTSDPWLPIHGVLQVGDNLAHQVLCDLLFMAQSQLGKDGSCIATAVGHGVWQDWGNWDVCVVTTNCLHGTDATVMAPEKINDSKALGSAHQESGQQQALSRK